MTKPRRSHYESPSTTLMLRLCRSEVVTSLPNDLLDIIVKYCHSETPRDEVFSMWRKRNSENQQDIANHIAKYCLQHLRSEENNGIAQALNDMAPHERSELLSFWQFNLDEAVLSNMYGWVRDNPAMARTLLLRAYFLPSHDWQKEEKTLVTCLSDVDRRNPQYFQSTITGFFPEALLGVALLKLSLYDLNQPLAGGSKISIELFIQSITARLKLRHLNFSEEQYIDPLFYLNSNDGYGVKVRVDFHSANLTGVTLRTYDTSGLDFSNADLTGAIFPVRHPLHHTTKFDNDTILRGTQLLRVTDSHKQCAPLIRHYVDHFNVEDQDQCLVPLIMYFRNWKKNHKRCLGQNSAELGKYLIALSLLSAESSNDFCRSFATVKKGDEESVRSMLQSRYYKGSLKEALDKTDARLVEQDTCVITPKNPPSGPRR